VSAGKEPAEVEELRCVASLGSGAKPREIGSEIAVLGDEIANAALAERAQSALLRLGERCRECGPARRTRGDDDVALSRRAPLTPRRNATRSSVALGVIQPNETGEVSRPRSAVDRRLGQAAR